MQAKTWVYRGESAGCLGGVLVCSGVFFAFFFLWEEWEPVGFSSYQRWALKADFVLLYHDPGIPSPDTMQLFSFCQHTLPMGFAAAMENRIKHERICSLTSCEQGVNITTAV